MAARVAVVDLEMGNLASVERALQHVAPAVEFVRVRGPAALQGAAAVVLPGVGAFAAAMEALRQRELLGPVVRWLEQGRPLLGICLGFQLLFEASEEAGAGPAPPAAVAGVGWFRGTVRRFQPPLTVPHMGWNQLHHTGLASPLLEGVDDGSYVYFAHSYYAAQASLADGRPVAVATTRVGGAQAEVEFVSAAWHEAAGGVQFHPEKSGHVGLRVLANFLRFALGERAVGPAGGPLAVAGERP
ncbi:MAG TPA: imidazole glycerol phosphate synthase subunit HisH [Limnochordales bacterium]